MRYLNILIHTVVIAALLGLFKAGGQRARIGTAHTGEEVFSDLYKRIISRKACVFGRHENTADGRSFPYGRVGVIPQEWRPGIRGVMFFVERLGDRTAKGEQSAVRGVTVCGGASARGHGPSREGARGNER